MNSIRRLSAVVVAAILGAWLPAHGQPAASPQVVVSYVDPGTSASADRALRELKRHLERRAPRVLAPGQQLVVRITGLSRAGHESWTPGTYGLRVVSDNMPARLNLRFELLDAAGARVSEGERSLRSPPYFAGDRSSDPLRFEKSLLDDWLAEEFPPRS